MKIAIVHDWLTVYGGAERVLEQMLTLYPQADLFAVCEFLPEAQRAFLNGRRVRTTFIQHMPLARKRYRSYLPLMPLAIEQLDLSGYDLVLSSSYAVAKGVITGPGQLHISYVHSPMRYAWDLQHQYLRNAGLDKGVKSWMVRWMLHKARIWDAVSATRVDQFIANSHFVARRIKKAYGRDSRVIYPPVDVDYFQPRGDRQEFFLAASRVVPYKGLDLIVRAFARMPERKLVVIGDGPGFGKLKKMCSANVSLMGRQPRETLRRYLRSARAFVFAAEEDFGILPVEAQACGTPVIAFGRGGACETVRGMDEASPTGLFFGEQSVNSVIRAVVQFEEKSSSISPDACRSNASRFSISCFRDELEAFVEESCEVMRTRKKIELI